LCISLFQSRSKALLTVKNDPKATTVGFLTQDDK
jgi:hypothetical protein